MHFSALVTPSGWAFLVHMPRWSSCLPAQGSRASNEAPRCENLGEDIDDNGNTQILNPLPYARDLMTALQIPDGRWCASFVFGDLFEEGIQESDHDLPQEGVSPSLFK